MASAQRQHDFCRLCVEGIDGLCPFSGCFLCFGIGIDEEGVYFESLGWAILCSQLWCIINRIALLLVYFSNIGYLPYAIFSCQN